MSTDAPSSERSAARSEGYLQSLVDVPVIDPFGVGAEVRVITRERFQLLHQRVPGGADGPLHQHPNDQVIYVLGGILDVEIDGTAFVAEAGDVVLFPTHSLHKVSVRSDAEWVEVFSPARTDLT